MKVCAEVEYCLCDEDDKKFQNCHLDIAYARSYDNKYNNNKNYVYIELIFTLQSSIEVSQI